MRQFSKDAYFHVYNRGVDKRTIFMDYADYRRFLKSMIAFNEIGRRADRSLSTIEVEKSAHPYVHIYAYCLMPNHFHLLLQSTCHGGISEYLRRIGTGYTKYFNIKYGRSGRLFESPFKAKPIESDAHLRHMSRYIHLNPLSQIEPGWKSSGVKNWKRAHRYLREYPWSSYKSYLSAGEDALISRTLIQREFQRIHDYVRYVKSWATKNLQHAVLD